MNEDSTEVVRVLLHSVVKCLDLLLVEKAQDTLFQLTTAFAGDDLYEANPLFNGFIDDGTQCPLDIVAAVVDVVKVEFQLHGAPCESVISRATSEALLRVSARLDREPLPLAPRGES
jgi:hypothetical protein